MSKDDRFLQAGIGSLYQKLSMDDYHGDDKACGMVIQYMENLDKARKAGVGIMAYGPPGTGKTMLMCEILKKALVTPKYSVGIFYTATKTTLPQMVTSMTQGWRDAEEQREFERRLVNVDFLLIDDVEKGLISSNVDLQRYCIDSCIRARVEMERPILITSNQEPKELTVIFGEAIGSLLKGHVMPIQFEGNDFREEYRAVKKWSTALTS